MKLRLSLMGAIILLLIPAISFSQQWVPGDRLTVGWNASTGYDDGSPLEPGMTIQYRVYTAKLTGPTPGTPELKATTSALQAQVIFSSHGQYYVGVEAVLFSGTTEIERSSTCWSSDAACCLNGNTFGGRWRVLVGPNGLKVITN